MHVLSFDISGDQIDGARDYQEDAFLITHLSNEDDDPQSLVVVADGMGGHAAGNVASNMAVQAFNKHVSSNYPVEDASLIPDILRTSVNKANDALSETVKETAALAGMGCTMVGILLAKGKLWWASVGDSHLYLIRNNEIRKLNADHSYGGFLDRMAAEGKNIEVDPSLSRNMLMSALTGAEIAEIDVSKEAFELKPNDNIIVCSDGMDTLSREEILKQAAWAPDAKQTAKILLKAVEDAERPRQDNTTVVNIRTKQVEVKKAPAYDLPSSAKAEAEEKPAAKEADTPAETVETTDEGGKSGGGMGKIIAIVIVLAIIGAAAAFFMMQSDKPQTVPMAEESVTEEAVTEEPVAEESAEAATPEPSEPAESVAASEPEAEVAAKPAKKKRHFVNPFTDSLKSGGRGPIMVVAPEGEYEMGAPSYSANIDERPKHKVALGEFAISQYEITYAEYEVFAKAMGKSAPERSEVNPQTYPVVNVSWQDAQDYAAWLTRQTGQKYSLPSEAQWEYAARAGTDTRYWWGLDIGNGNAHCQGCGSPASLRKAAPVGSFEANAWGLYDTSGNVAEWTLDCFNRNYEGAPGDGSAWQDGDCSKRIVRGGSFSNTGDGSTNTRRKSYPAGAKLSHLGFRVVREK
jgi:formylglycine-generating enzyme required for sulfatase activity/serine/threonine protein phosphatase PrpC